MVWSEGDSSVGGPDYDGDDEVITGFGRGTCLDKTILTGAEMYGCSFQNVDLSAAVRLDEVIHGGPSSIDIGMIYCSKGKIPDVFLLGSGVPEVFITYARSLVGSRGFLGKVTEILQRI